jgi:hypothetical protein
MLRPRRLTTATPLLLGAAVLALSVVGRATATSSGSAPSDPVVVWNEFVDCAHQHGYPDMPRPQVGPDGQARFPDTAGFSAVDVKLALEALHDACGQILQRLPALANPFAPKSGGSAEADRAKLREDKLKQAQRTGQGGPKDCSPGP